MDKKEAVKYVLANYRYDLKVAIKEKHTEEENYFKGKAKGFLEAVIHFNVLEEETAKQIYKELIGDLV